MNPWEKDLLDAFLEEEDLVGAGACALTAALTGGADVEAPGAGLRDRLMAEATTADRFDRFLGVVAELMDVDDAGARALVAGLHRPESFEPSPLPGVSLYHIDGGSRVERAVTGFVHMPAGAAFPEHSHLGLEKTLIIQGSLQDSSGVIYRPGDIAEQSFESAHSFVVRPGPDLVYLFVAQNGIKIGDEEFGPDHPDT